MTFSLNQTVTYHGYMLPELLGRPLVVILAHGKSGLGDPATDDVCLVRRLTGGDEIRVSSCNLRPLVSA